MRRLLNLLIVATLLLVPSLSVASAAAPRRAPAKKAAVKKPAAVKSVRTKAAPAPRVNVKSYTKKNGTVVASHQRTSSNGTQTDNWSSKGNVNPNTGKVGTKTVQK
jgi:Tfp pilus assembly protein FimV